jgi:hypothetical protein
LGDLLWIETTKGTCVAEMKKGGCGRIYCGQMERTGGTIAHKFNKMRRREKNCERTCVARGHGRSIEKKVGNGRKGGGGGTRNDNYGRAGGKAGRTRGRQEARKEKAGRGNIKWKEGRRTSAVSTASVRFGHDWYNWISLRSGEWGAKEDQKKDERKGREARGERREATSNCQWQHGVMRSSGLAV